MVRCLVLCASLVCVSGFPPPYSSLGRRDAGKSIALFAGAGFNLPSFFSAGGGAIGAPPAAAAGGRTNDVVKTVAGIRHRRLGGGDIVVSEVGLGTQRWGGADFNSPDEALCHSFLDMGTANGINLVDTAEQYPIPSDRSRPEGRTEEIIGNWLSKDRSRRDKLVIATKITGGANITPRNIIKDCEGSLKRLQTDYIDVYNLHWPARYTPQSNWGQSLEYNHEAEEFPYYRDHASFDEIVSAMGKLIQAGKIRGYGSCNGTTLLSLLGCTFAVAEKHAHLACSLHSRARAFSQLTVDTFLCLAC